MTTEKQSIRFILERRGVINNGKFDPVRFQKLVTEPWIRAKTLKYGFDKMNENDAQVVDNEPVIKEVVEIQEPITVIEEPVTVIEEPIVEEAVETSTESVLLEEDLKEEIEDPVVETAEEPVVENTEVPAEEPVVEMTEEVVETSKKKTSKKK